MKYIDQLDGIAKEDILKLHEKEKEYGGSWKKRGGANAFFMLCRKWDRLEHFVEKYNWDIFKSIEKDTRKEGVLDDIQDLRRYLMLVEAEMICREKKDRNYKPDFVSHGFQNDK